MALERRCPLLHILTEDEIASLQEDIAAISGRPICVSEISVKFGEKSNEIRCKTDYCVIIEPRGYKTSAI